VAIFTLNQERNELESCGFTIAYVDGYLLFTLIQTYPQTVVPKKHIKMLAELTIIDRAVSMRVDCNLCGMDHIYEK
jgi:hypothetical protein